MNAVGIVICGALLIVAAYVLALLLERYLAEID